jgi:hypothetical protein
MQHIYRCEMDDCDNLDVTPVCEECAPEVQPNPKRKHGIARARAFRAGFDAELPVAQRLTKAV